ncbi:hypothetical protein L1D14_20570 [Vibrio tubiashii]|uniref:hypothetical protein n=1 Tax=Vibrio tubiashii TaxID=29498 RepID=UPI001EFCE59A|nr:hypothetical protein [Vibrio tubiashii]MCG9578616.1 hypothetical protein [Vibrio tubiashii]
MTAFYRKKSKSFDCLVTGMVWKHHIGISGSSLYSGKFGSLFESNTAIGVREGDHRAMTVGVVESSDELISDTSHCISVALQLRQYNRKHSRTAVSVNNDESNDGKHDEIQVYISQIEEDIWHLVGFSFDRIVIDKTISRANSVAFADEISDLFFYENDHYRIELTTIDVLDEDVQSVIKYAIANLQLGDRLEIRLKHQLDIPLLELLESTIEGKEGYFRNVKSFRKTSSLELGKHALLASIIIAALGVVWSYVAAPEKKGSDAFSAPVLSVSVPTPPLPVLSNATSSAEEIRNAALLVLDRAKSQEKEWLEEFIRAKGHNHALAVQKAIGELPYEVNGYRLVQARFIDKRIPSDIDAEQYIHALYKRFDDNALLYEFTREFNTFNPSLDGETVFVTIPLPSSNLEKSYNLSRHDFEPVQIISSLQSYLQFNSIDSWSMNSSTGNERPIELNERQLSSFKAFYKEDATKTQYLIEISTYRVQVQSTYLKSVEVINDLIQQYPSAVLTSMTFNTDLSTITTEITIYDPKI